MKLLKQGLIFFSLIFISQSCATLISRSVYPFTIESNPIGAKILIKNRKEKVVYEGQTPVTIALRSGAGYFRRASYTVTLSKEGFKDQSFPITTTLDGWYAGNLLLSGLFGLLIIDPATGAMYKLKGDFIKLKLAPKGAVMNDAHLKIYDLASVPTEWKNHLIKINLK